MHTVWLQCMSLILQHSGPDGRTDENASPFGVELLPHIGNDYFTESLHICQVFPYKNPSKNLIFFLVKNMKFL